MPEARVFQSWFAEAIIAPSSPKAVPPSFSVYRNTWLKGLLDALEANYPTVAMILGANVFKAVALQFARENPARTPVLALYGTDFPDFLARLPVGADLPYLRDVAVLERLWTESFFAPDAPILEASDYASHGPGELIELRPYLHSAARFARFETPAVTIWDAHRSDDQFEQIEPEWKGECALVTRRGTRIWVRLIDDAAHRLLVEIGRGQALGVAIAATAEALPGCDLANALDSIISSAALAAPQPEDERIW